MAQKAENVGVIRTVSNWINGDGTGSTIRSLGGCIRISDRREMCEGRDVV